MRVNIINPYQGTSYLFGGWQIIGGLFPSGWGPRFLTYSDTDSTTYYNDGYIVEGTKNRDDERSCLHMHMSGSAVAVPSSAVSRDIVDLKVYSFDDSPTESFEQFTANPNGIPKTWVGPLLDAHAHNLYYTRKFPDYFGSKNQYRNLLVTVMRIAKFVIRTEVTYEWRKTPTRNWSTLRHVGDMIYNLDTHKYGYNGVASTNMIALNAIPPGIPNYNTTSLFPKNFKGYDKMYQALLKGYLPLNNDLYFGDLVRRCANDARTIPTNSIELVSELAQMSTTLRSLLKLGTGKVDAKTLASAYLAYKYGPKLTAAGLKTVAEGLFRKVTETNTGKSRARARELVTLQPYRFVPSKASVEFNYKINYYIHSDDWRDFIRSWFNSGLFPSLTNAWDLVPLSFVLDWFFKVESYLDAIDANTYWSTYSISSTVYSKKTIFQDVGWYLSDANWTLTGDVQYVVYSRSTGSNVHKPVFFDPQPRDFKNYAELTSLIVVFSGN